MAKVAFKHHEASPASIPDLMWTISCGPRFCTSLHLATWAATAAVKVPVCNPSDAQWTARAQVSALYTETSPQDTPADRVERRWNEPNEVSMCIPPSRLEIGCDNEVYTGGLHGSTCTVLAMLNLPADHVTSCDRTDPTLLVPGF